MMLLMGKHQFMISSIDDLSHQSGGGGGSGGGAMSLGLGRRSASVGKISPADAQVINDLLLQAEEFEQYVADITASGGNGESAASAGGAKAQDREEELKYRLRELNNKLSLHLSQSRRVLGVAEADGLEVELTGRHGGSDAMEEARSGLDGDDDGNADGDGESLQRTEIVPAGKSLGGRLSASRKHLIFDDDDKEHQESVAGSDQPSMAADRKTRRESISHVNKRCTITCFSPESSPLVGKSFAVGAAGATIGRKTTNDIALVYSSYVQDDQGVMREHITNMDTAISAEHARIFMDQETGEFFITDGTATKASTNGTWFRLSGPQQESAFFTIEPNTELLIGTVRFQAGESMTISEQSVEKTMSLHRSASALARGIDLDAK
jgi:FHA domain